MENSCVVAGASNRTGKVLDTAIKGQHEREISYGDENGLYLDGIKVTS